MSCGDKGDVNVCLSRVGGFGERLASPHSQSQVPATSLLTFADMVLALDNRIVDNDKRDSSNRENLQDDHNYASNKSHKMTTRSQSQAMRVNKKQSENLDYFDLNSRNEKNIQCLSHSDPGDKGSHEIPQSPSSQDGHYSLRSIHKRSEFPFTLGCNSCDGKGKHDAELKVKRSSSVENVTVESITTDCCSEWPQTSRKNSPRKSCSFEEVNKNSTGYRKSEDRKGGSSGQLHRLVNDTLEFPCWPRKADHTYATATWDGTAASHGIFEQEMMNENDARIEDSKMEVTETFLLPLKKRSINAHFDVDEQQKNTYPYQQKDDHTYVKQNNAVSSSTNIFPAYSCSTFPRQKSRDDHTYFSSGLNKHGPNSSGKDWNSVNTVSNLSHIQGKERAELTDGRNVVPEIVSAKKDHNYFTSAR